MAQFSPRVFGVCLLVISVLIGMIFLGPLLWFNRIDIIDYANLGRWREVEAHLNSNFTEFMPESDNRYRAVVNYSYEFNDKKYTGTRVRLFRSTVSGGPGDLLLADGKEGSLIQVWIDPVLPERSVISKKIEDVNYHSIWLVGALIVLLLYVFCLSIVIIVTNRPIFMKVFLNLD